jgi:hypothetical protein
MNQEEASDKYRTVYVYICVCVCVCRPIRNKSKSKMGVHNWTMNNLYNQQEQSGLMGNKTGRGPVRLGIAAHPLVNDL